MSTPSPTFNQLLRCTTWLVLLLTLVQPAAYAANDKGIFYRAQRDNVEIYLLGSMHVASPDLYPLRAAMEVAFGAADTLVVEVDITRIDHAAVATWMTEHGFYPEGDSLRNHLRAETWQRLSKYLQKQDIDPASLERQKPGLLVMMLTMLQMNADGLQAALGIDQHFLNAANTVKKPVFELETVVDQLTLIAAMPNPDKTINLMLDEIEDTAPYIDELSTAWKSGDAEKFEPLILTALTGDDAESRAYFSRILEQRNRSMTQRLLAQCRATQKLFVVVGAAHLVGTEGIPALLKQAGFEITQI
ncbi:MAG: TraB/GumN family protein [Spongiibacteraceae bacterium]